MYTLRTNSFNQTVVDRVDSLISMTGFPMHPDNTDYQQFKIDVAAGAELKDANNNVMTAEQANTFLATLP